MLKIVRGRIYHNVIDEIKDLFSSLYISLDNQEVINSFEKEFANRIGTKYAKTMPFARYALYEILKYKNFPKDSEIIMPPITIKPMVDIVLMLGLKPIFVDIELDTLCFNKEELEKSISPNTKAILLTYLFGIVPNMDNILNICKKNDLFVIEDFSHTVNAKYKDKQIGSFGDVSIYSSSSLKTVDTYIGGTVFTNDKNLYSYLESILKTLPSMPRIFLFKKIFLNFLRNLFSKSFVFTFITSPLLNLLKNINKDFYKKVLGARLNLKPVVKMPEDWTYKFTSLQASRGLKQLKIVDEIDLAKIDNVNKLKNYLDENYWDLLPKENEFSKNVYWQYPFYVKDIENFLLFLEKNNIDAGTTNLSLCSHLDIYPEYIKNTKNAYLVKNNYIFLPTYKGLSDKKIKYVAKKLTEYFN